MQSKKKILIITHNYPEGRLDRQNAGTFVQDFACELVRKNNTVHVFCPGEKDGREIIHGVIIHRFGWRKDKKLGQLKLWNPFDIVCFFLFFIRGTKGVIKLGKKILPDHALAMWAIPSGALAFFLKKECGIPYSVWALGSDIYVYGKIPIIGIFVKEVLLQANALFADGVDLSRKVTAISGKKCIFLPSASKFVVLDELLGKVGVTPDRKIVLTFLGRMENVKGPDLLLESLVKVKNTVENLEVNFIGDGRLLEKLKNKANLSGLSEIIRFHGNLSDKKQIARIFFKSTWLVIPSRSDSIPLVFSEGMKMGLPVIVSDLPDLKYLVDKYKVGVHFKTGSISELASIISAISSRKRGSYKKYMNFKKNTKTVARFFSIEKSAETFLGIHE